jgi:hypothetical protein
MQIHIITCSPGCMDMETHMPCTPDGSAMRVRAENLAPWNHGDWESSKIFDTPSLTAGPEPEPEPTNGRWMRFQSVYPLFNGHHILSPHLYDVPLACEARCFGSGVSFLSGAPDSAVRTHCLKGRLARLFAASARGVETFGLCKS